MTSAAAGSAKAMPAMTGSATTRATYRRIVDVRMESPLIVRLPRASKGAATAPFEHGLRPGWRRLLRRRNAERRVAGAARLPAEVLHHDLGGRRVLGASRVTKLDRPLPHVLCRGVELGPLLPDLGLRLGFVGERALREQHRNVLGVEGHRLGVDGDSLDVTSLHLGLGVGPARAVELHQALAIGDDVAGADLLRSRAGGTTDGDHCDETDHDDAGGHVTLHPASLDRKSTRLNSSHVRISYAVFCLKNKKEIRYV